MADQIRRQGMPSAIRRPGQKFLDGNAADAGSHQFQPRTLQHVAAQRDFIARHRSDLDVAHMRFARSRASIACRCPENATDWLAPDEIQDDVDALTVSPSPASGSRNSPNSGATPNEFTTAAFIFALHMMTLRRRLSPDDPEHHRARHAGMLRHRLLP